MTTKEPVWKQLISYVVRWLLPLALTVLLLCYMFRKVNFSDMWHLITHGVDYWWILLAMAISVFSHIFRALRWRIQLRSLGITPPLMALCCSIFGTYALNLVFPRLGEVWRCTYIASREKKPVTEIVGSMVADRFSDLIMVFIITLFTLIVAAPAIEAFLEKYPIGRDLIALVQNPLIWLLFAVIVLLIWGVFAFGRNLGPIIKIRRWVAEMWHGFADVAGMKGKWQFLGYSIAIWACYYVQLYVAFFAFPFTRALCVDPSLAFGLVPCLVAFVLSSIGMAVPSNGGLGPWNIAVMFGLAIYGVTDAEGTAFSMLQWSGQTVMLIVLGIFTMIYISIGKRENRMKPKTAPKP
ncbi:MAG: flippase-like domain-containing protein [Candidatus Amulumruptor caecigallinarius]|nr:flippase-like domain-containing protein [Candidatus Amulumruptor caecigallinarius]